MQLNGIDVARLIQRKQLLSGFDQFRRDADARGMMEGFDSLNRRALDILTSSRLAEALDISREDASVRERYGKGDDRCYYDGAPRNLEQFLMARRLVEAGARVVTLNFGRWDFHANNFSECKNTHFPLFDQGMHALVTDLHERGLDQDVAVVAWGEFGRTPRINPEAGRDHWPDVGNGLIAGGGFRTGQIIGATDRTGAKISDRPIHFGEVHATLYHHFGIDPTSVQLQDLSSRPQYLVENWKPMPELADPKASGMPPENCQLPTGLSSNRPRDQFEMTLDRAIWRLPTHKMASQTPANSSRNVPHRLACWMLGMSWGSGIAEDSDLGEQIRRHDDNVELRL